jgi:hypothetical protein
MTLDPVDTNLKEQAILNRSFDDDTDTIKVSIPSGVAVTTGDIEIGAVEIKNSTDDTRATVSSKGLHVYDTAANSLVPGTYDYIAPTFATLTDTWVFKTGGSGGTTVSTITITYTDSGKGTISSIVKT